jgi:hypothetical protein
MSADVVWAGHEGCSCPRGEVPAVKFREEDGQMDGHFPPGTAASEPSDHRRSIADDPALWDTPAPFSRPTVVVSSVTKCEATSATAREL